MAVGEKLVGHLRIFALDERVARSRIREIALPAFGGSADESREDLRALRQRVARDGEHFGIRWVAELREQEHDRLHTPLLDRKGLGCREALLRKLAVDEKGLDAERV